MKHYVKNLFDFSQPNSIPTFYAQVEEFHCPLCRNRVRVAVPSTAVDWEEIAKDYRRYSEKMWAECNRLLSEAGVDRLLQAELKAVLKKCAEIII